MQATEQRLSRGSRRTQLWTIPATQPHAGPVGLLKLVVIGSKTQVDVTEDTDAAALRAFALAPTLPAVPLPTHMAELQTLREPTQLRLRTGITNDELAGEQYPAGRAHAATEVSRGVVMAPRRRRSVRAWELWLRQPSHLVIGVAAMLSVLSLLAAGLLVR